MKKIFVPCDFSEHALQAYEFAMNIAARSGGSVMVLNVIDLPITYETTLGTPVYYFDENILKDLEAQAKEDFKKMKAQSLHNENTSFSVSFGPVTLKIQEFIEDQKIDLVVMGTRGASGWKEYLIGSNTEKIVRFSKAPVFAIRKSFKLNEIKNIVFPTTLELNQTDLIHHIKELQSFFNATLHLLLVNTPYNFKRTKEDKELLEEYAEHYKLKDYTLNIYDDFFADDGIINFAHQIKADMIGMATHGRKGLAHLFAGSVTEDVVNHVDCPIWTYSSIKK
jgi:nucleotide-binding universal stress UspA family protein